MNLPLKGIITPFITPLNNYDELDIPGLEKLIEHQVSGGIHGGHGAVAGGANLFPKMFVDLYKASLTNDLESISIIREKVLMLYQTIYQVGKHPSRYVKSTKCGLSVLGICNDYLAPPLHRFKPSERKQIEDYLERMLT